MIRTATLPLRGTRTNAFTLPIIFRGPDLTGADLEAFVLQNWDNDPAAPEISLPDGVAAGVTGLRFISASTVDGQIETRYDMTIAAAAMAAIPDAPEIGGDVNWVWYLNITPSGGVKQRYIEGEFVIGGSASGNPSNAEVTISDEDVIIAIDGADLVQQMVDEATAAVTALTSNAGYIAISADLALGGASKISICAANISPITTVAGIASNVTTVAGAATSVNTVAANISLLGSVYANLSTITAAAAASATAGVYGNTSASYVPRGVTSVTLTAGSGGTNSTNVAATLSGGNFSINPTVTFDIVGGAVTNVRYTPGLYIGSSPTAPTVTLPGAAGGAALVLNVGYLVGSGSGYWSVSSDGYKLLRYSNSSNVATLDATVGALYTAAGIDAQQVVVSGNGAPGYQVGLAGQYYDDLTTGLRYGPKSSAGWPSTGVAVTKGTAIPTTRTRVDFRVSGARFPTEHWTFTRGSVSTDMLETDPYTYPYTTYANDTPVMRVGKGFYSYMRAQQFLSNPTAPASHTTAGNVAVGTAILLVWGPVGASVTVAAGTAVGTGWGTANCNGTSAVKIVLTITTLGTVAVTVSGAVTYFNLQQNPSSPTATEAVPFIATTGIREPDKAVATSTMLALLTSTAGYMLMNVSNVTGRSYGRSPCLWGLNNVTAGYCPSDTQYTFYDVANHTGLTTTGSDSFSAGATVARTWDATATVDFGAGNHTETQVAFQYNNGVAVTAATLGHPSTTNTSGANQLNGIIAWYEIDTAARITAEAMYEKYTSIPSPTLDALLKGYVGPSQFPHVTSQERLLQVGVFDHITYGVAGPSHEGGVATGTNIRQVAWMTQMVADLESQGYAVTDDAIVSMNSAAYSGGGNPNDSRDTYTGTAPTLGGVTFGGEYISVPVGTVLTFTPPTRQTARFHLAVYTNASYGNAEVSIDGGTTPIACNENGATSIPSTVSTFTASIADDLMTVTGTVTGVALAAGDIISGGTAIAGTRILSQVSGTTGGAGVYRVHIGKQTVASATMTVIIRQRTFNATLGMNAWSTKATGNLIKIAYRYARNPAIAQRVFFNGGRNGFNVTNLAQDSSPESSYLMLIRALGFAAVIGGIDQTNDMASGGTDFQSVYDPKSYAIISAIRATADPVGLTDPPSSTSVYTLAVQDKIVNQARAVYWKYGVPYYDLYGWKTVQGVTSGYSVIFPTGLYGSDTIHLAKQGHKRLKANQMRDLLKRLWAAA